MPRAGIVYTLTRNDAEAVARWLHEHGIAARAYHGGVRHPDFRDSNSYRIHLEEQLQANEFKVLVATSALGMGFNKPDLGFVIHFQAPGSLLTYYQQVGRAGRDGAMAYGILLAGARTSTSTAISAPRPFRAGNGSGTFSTRLTRTEP